MPSVELYVFQDSFGAVASELFDGRFTGLAVGDCIELYPETCPGSEFALVNIIEVPVSEFSFQEFCEIQRKATKKKELKKDPLDFLPSIPEPLELIPLED